MKNIKNLLVASYALVCAASMAVVQPGVPVSEDAPTRISVGLHGNMGSINDKFGADAVGLGLGFAHNVGYDFEYGIAISGDWAAHGNRLFSDEAKNTQGALFSGELMARFMPEIAERFHLGGVVGLGLGHQFGGGEDAKVKAAKAMVTFGNMAVRAGLGLSFGFSDMCALYLTPAYTLTSIRIHSDKATPDFKKTSNLSGAEAPLGFMFSVSDNVGMFVEANTKFVDFENFTKSWREDVTLGVNFAM